MRSSSSISHNSNTLSPNGTPSSQNPTNSPSTHCINNLGSNNTSNSNNSNITLNGQSSPTPNLHHNTTSGSNNYAAPLPPNFTSPFLQTVAQQANSNNNNPSLPIVYQVTPSSYKREQSSRLSTKQNLSTFMKIYIWLCSVLMMFSQIARKSWKVTSEFLASVISTTQENGQIQMNSRQLTTKKRKTLVLDLDETLIHSTIKANETGYDFQIEVNIEGVSYTFYIFKRPHVNYFLEKVSEWFDLVIFTASLRPYASPVIEKLDTKKLVKAVLYRESCVMRNGHLVKDLGYAGFDVTSTIIIDNSPIAYSLNRENAIPIDHYFGKESNPGDKALLNMIPILDTLRFANDVRPILRPK